MDTLQNATQIIKRLKKDAKIQMDAGYFSRRVTEGYIPHHLKDGTTKKFYKYDEVIQSLKDSQDPTRDAQRETIEKKRESKERDELLEQLRSHMLNNPIQTDFFSDELKDEATFEIDIDELETECIAAIEVNHRLAKVEKSILKLLSDLKDTGELKPKSKHNDEFIEVLVKWFFYKESYSNEEILNSFIV